MLWTDHFNRLWRQGFTRGVTVSRYSLLKDYNEQQNELELTTSSTEAEDGISLHNNDKTPAWPEPRSTSRPRTVSLICGIALLLLTLIGLVLLSNTKIRSKLQLQSTSLPTDTAISLEAPDTNKPPPSTSNCTVRREWRTLTPRHQQQYISALHCLRRTPSQLTNLHNQPPNVSAYSDFPYLHARIGYRTHNSASFLPWHRYLLHVFERTLREKCGYSEGLVYWDWTRDAEDLAASPVFDPITGFGGDGDPDGEITVGQHGRCVIDGPFAGTQALWYDVKYAPHCLSRGFRTDAGSQGKIDGTGLRPDVIRGILELGTYEEFVAALEKRVHDVIPFGVGGDFETFSAPFDPLFYLHHVQLDRLWWVWQGSAEGRWEEYGGHKERHSIEMASVEDTITLGKSIAVDVSVQDVMDPRREQGRALLCYDYT